MASKQDTTSQKPAMCYVLCTGDTSDAIYTAKDADIYIIGSNRNREGVFLSYTPLSCALSTPAVVDAELKADAPKPKSKSVIESTLAPEPIKQEKKSTENEILDRSAIASSAASVPAIVEKSKSAKEPSKPAMQYFLPTGDTSDAIYTPEEAERYICGKNRNRFGVDITILSHNTVNNTPSVDVKAKLERDDLTAVSKKIVADKDKNKKTEKQRFVTNDETSKTEPVIELASIITKEADNASLVAEKDSNVDYKAMVENKETEKTVESREIITKAPEKFSSVSATAKSGEDSSKSTAGFVDEAIAGAATAITTATLATINKLADSDKKEKQIIEKNIASENDNVNTTNASFSERNVSERDLEDDYVKASANKDVKSVSTKKEETKEATKTDTVKTTTESDSESSSDDTSDDDSDDSDNSSSEGSDSDSDEESDSDDSDDSDDSEDDEEASESEKEQPEVFLYTSFSSAMINMVSRTNRMAHILESHKIKFTYVDVATDERAKRLWRWKSKGRMLPGIVRDGEIICDFPELEEINEDHEVWAKVVEEEVY
ncbi:hypothetical protein D0Z03_002503 [Geotrichum reessii]|nr:hypothetical protein D0Z03_002503 [Galactomyces reessii]